MLYFYITFVKMRIRYIAECLEHSFKNLPGALARYGHTYLATHALLRPLKNEVVGERLQACTLAVHERAVLFPVIDMRAAAARSRHGVRRFLRV